MAEYDAPTVPGGRLVVVMVIVGVGVGVGVGESLTTSVKVLLSDPVLFLAVAVTL